RHRPRGDRLEDRRGAALLPDVARALRGGGLRDDRLRLRRADHEGAPARVRGRAEPPDPAPDGRIGWLNQPAFRTSTSSPFPFPTSPGPTSSTERRYGSRGTRRARV